jgi:hypothetical protein
VNVNPTSAVVLAANAQRTRVTFTNDASVNIWLALGPTATASSGIQLTPLGGRFITDNYRGQVSAILDSRPGPVNLCIQEES